ASSAHSPCCEPDVDPAGAGGEVREPSARQAIADEPALEHRGEPGVAALLLPLVDVVDDAVAGHRALAVGEVGVGVARVLHRRLAGHPEPLATEADDPAVAHAEGDVLVLAHAAVETGRRACRRRDATDGYD